LRRIDVSAVNPIARRNASGVTILAEAAQGYEGEPTLARLLVRAAARGGADMVKFQIIFADELAVPGYRHYQLFKQLEMSSEAWHKVAEETARSGIAIAFDVYGERSLSLALEVGASAVKIHATDFFNHALVEAALRSAPQVYFSAGGIEIDEVDEFLRRHAPYAQDKLTMLCGFQAEPTAPGDNNIARLAVLRQRFPSLPFGFMDHAEGESDEALWLGVLALPYGITAIEKHITIDRSLQLEDYVSAVAADNFSRYVKRIRLAEAALGTSDLTLTEAERAYRRRAAKVVVAIRHVPRGNIVRATDVRLLRASLDENQRPYHRLEAVVGRPTKREVAPERPVLEEDLA